MSPVTIQAARRVPAVLALLLTFGLLLALGACGIRGSDVVEAGDAAAVPVDPPPALRMTLFFVDGAGRLRPVVRDGDGVSNRANPSPTHPGTGDGVASLLDDTPLKPFAALLDGPTAAERALGLRTRLPGPEHGQHELFVSPDAIKRGQDGEPVFRVRYMGPVTELDPLAVQQIVCTTVYALHPAGRVSVVLTGPDGTLPTRSCPPTDEG
ncbi:hypothetical protein ACFV9D_08415 [Streptomyces sp. NPDC059875]|uniref:hypothetical protein n=1 Tax=unclassified Streptomyces TaxID=2593676 RepID=UPI0036594A58